MTPDPNNLTLFPGHPAAQTKGETGAQGEFLLRAPAGPAPLRPGSPPGPRHLRVSGRAGSAGSRCAPSRAARRGLAESCQDGGGQTGAPEPAPERPPGDTPEPPEERAEAAPDGEDDPGREHGTGPGEAGVQGLL